MAINIAFKLLIPKKTSTRLRRTVQELEAETCRGLKVIIEKGGCDF